MYFVRTQAFFLRKHLVYTQKPCTFAQNFFDLF